MSETRFCDQGCGYKLLPEYGPDETTCGACLDDLEGGFGNESACDNCGDEWAKLDARKLCDECAEVTDQINATGETA